MAETGWPLIPREVLPAPVRAVRPARRRALPAVDPAPLDAAPVDGAPIDAAPVDGARTDSGRQLSIFGADTTEPSPVDLAGLLAGPGRLGRMGGTARVSIRVDAAWRVHVLVSELVRRGLVVTWLPVESDRQPLDSTDTPPPTAGTTLDQHTAPDQRPARPPAREAHDEPVGAVIGRSHPATADPDTADNPADPDPPDTGRDADSPADRGGGATGVAGAGGVALFEVRTAYSRRLNALARSWPAAAHRLFLSGPRLRLWVAAAGRPMAGGYALGLDPDDDPAIVDAALIRAGLAGRVSDDGRYYLILGRKRLARLAELVGERPDEAPVALWPSGATA